VKGNTMKNEMAKLDQEIVERVALRYQIPAFIANHLNIPVEVVRDVVAKNTGKIQELRKEFVEKQRGRLFKKLGKLSFTAYEEILSMDSSEPVVVKGEIVGQQVNPQVLKLKKEVADRVMEEMNVLTKAQRGGGTNIQINNKNEDKTKDALIEQKELREQLESCVIKGESNEEN
jgi:energy-converting hydrogenase A subunit M